MHTKLNGKKKKLHKIRSRDNIPRIIKKICQDYKKAIQALYFLKTKITCVSKNDPNKKLQNKTENKRQITNFDSSLFSYTDKVKE